MHTKFTNRARRSTHRCRVSTLFLLKTGARPNRYFRVGLLPAPRPTAAHALSFRGLIPPPKAPCRAHLHDPRGIASDHTSSTTPPPALPFTATPPPRPISLPVFRSQSLRVPSEKFALRPQSYKDALAERQPRRLTDVHRPSSTSHGQPRAARNLIAVVIRILVCPASIFWRVRMLRSAISANASCVTRRAIRSRRKLAPNAASVFEIVCRATPHHAVDRCLTERHNRP